MAIAIVLAGGSGSRMKSDKSKQYMLLNGRELIVYSLSVFQNNEMISDIVLVTKEEDIDFCKTDIVKKYNITKVSAVVSGGNERYDSVYQGVVAARKLAKDENEIVLIHDGARPFVTNKMIEASILCLKENFACTVGMPVKDTIKIVDENMLGVDTPDRSTLYQIQTPQSFKLNIIEEAYKLFYAEKSSGITDDTMLVERYLGIKSVVVEGSYTNIKITTPEDMRVAEIFVSEALKI